jgi:hypothetical protein
MECLHDCLEGADVIGGVKREFVERPLQQTTQTATQATSVRHFIIGP